MTDQLPSAERIVRNVLGRPRLVQNTEIRRRIVFNATQRGSGDDD